MTIAFDNSENSLTNQGDVTLGITPVGVARGVIALIGQRQPVDDTVTSVAYGGVDVVEMTGSPFLGTNAEAAPLYAYFLGAGIPSGTQNLVVSTNATRIKSVTIITLTADADMEENIAEQLLDSDSISNPRADLVFLSAVDSFVAEIFMSGKSAVGGFSPITGWTSRTESDIGSNGIGVYTYDTISGSTVSCGFDNTGGGDNVQLYALAVNEISGGGVTLTADTDEYTYVGTVADLSLSALLAGDTESYSYTGSVNELITGKSLSADTDQYDYIGNEVDLLLSAQIAGDSDSYLYTGVDAGLIIEKYLTADTSEYNYNGDASDLFAERLFSADTDQYAYDGSIAELNFTGVGNFNLTADTESYLYAGNDSGLLSGSNLTANTGQYNYDGTDAALIRNFSLIADTSQYAYSGTAATLLSELIVISEVGSYIITGTAVVLDFSGDSSAIWTDKTIAVTNWTAESIDITDWSDKADSSTAWTIIN
ncbi:MAG: hypothetical protein JKY22_12335 [Flavobacteriaceae bacterium]|nr:hypothetical protein [Flavobacteriaceae bacterium]